MARAVAQARRIAADPLDQVRMMIVLGCAAALILAERALPLA